MLIAFYNLAMSAYFHFFIDLFYTYEIHTIDYIYDIW